MKKIRIAMLGTGFMARAHTTALHKLDETEIVAVCHPKVESAHKFCQEHAGPGARAYSDFTDMLEKEPNLDAVYFCIPPGAHKGEVELAAKKGLAVFLEKPIAINAERARAMVQAIEGANVVSQVGFMMRFRQSVQALKKALDAGEAGEPTLFTGRFWVNMDGPPWWRDQHQSGGQIFEQLIHIFDLARYLCGDVEEARAHIANLLHQERSDYTIEDTNATLLRFKNGALGTITGSNCALPSHFFADFRIVCANAMLEYHCSGQPWVEADKAILYKADGSRESFTENSDVFLEENSHFVDCLRNSSPTLCPAIEGLRVIEVIEEALAQSRNK